MDLGGAGRPLEPSVSEHVQPGDGGGPDGTSDEICKGLGDDKGDYCRAAGGHPWRVSRLFRRSSRILFLDSDEAPPE